MITRCFKLAVKDIKWWLSHVNKDFNKAKNYSLHWVEHFIYCGCITEKQANRVKTRILNLSFGDLYNG